MWGHQSKALQSTRRRQEAVGHCKIWDLFVREHVIGGNNLRVKISPGEKDKKRTCWDQFCFSRAHQLSTFKGIGKVQELS